MEHSQVSHRTPRLRRGRSRITARASPARPAGFGPCRRMGPRGPGLGLHGAPEVPLEPVDGLLVPDGARAVAEHVPEPPALFVGIHSGAPFVWDAWTIGAQWWRHFGSSRRLHGTAHDALMALPGVGLVLPSDGGASGGARQHLCGTRGGPRRRAVAGRRGRLPPSVDPARRGDPRRPEGIHPAGDPQLRPDRPDLDGGRTRLDAGPRRGRRLARLLRLDRVARLKMFPIALQAPWGISPALLPEIPLPTKIRTAFQRRSRSTAIPAAPTTRRTSRRSTRRSAPRSRRGWTRSRVAGACPVRLNGARPDIDYLRRSTARCSWDLFMFERPSTPSLRASCVELVARPALGPVRARALAAALRRRHVRRSTVRERVARLARCAPAPC